MHAGHKVFSFCELCPRPHIITPKHIPHASSCINQSQAKRAGIHGKTSKPVNRANRSSESAVRFYVHLLNTSAAMGTVELTGFEMMATHAFGQFLAIASQSAFTIPGTQSG